MGPSPTRRQMEKSLHAEYRVPKRNPLARHGPWLAVVLGVLVALGAAVFVETWGGNQGAQDARLKVNAGEAAAAMLALGGFPIAYWQWRKGREEASLDALYLRLEHINELMMAAQHPPQVPEEGAPVDAKGALARYVFAEVDTLEHTHERYKLGYATTQQLYRVVTRLSTSP